MSDDHPAAWIARRHPLARLASSNERFVGIIRETIPQYHDLAAAADRARQRADALRAGAAHPQSDRPPSDGKQLDEWFDLEVERRVMLRDQEMRLQVLRELEFNTRTEAYDLLDQASDDLIRALSLQLEEYKQETIPLVDALGDEVHTAAQAIEAGSTDAWKAISAGLATYRDIRHVQTAVYQALRWPFDSNACGNSPEVNDLEARLYFHRRLPEVAPDWRGADAMPSFIGGAGTPKRDSFVPWPADPTERLIWCIRNDSGVWCPTPGEVTAMLNTVPPRIGRGNQPPGLRPDRRKSESRTISPSTVTVLR